MADIFEEAGIVPRKDNRKDIDRAVHTLLGVEFKDCPTTWKNVKARTRSDAESRAAFVAELRAAIEDGQ
jgi:hypothetical protein